VKAPRKQIQDLVVWNEKFFQEPHRPVVEKAKGLFFQRGFSSVHMDDLAAELAISKRTLYELFASKEEILQGALELVARALLTRNQAILDQPDLSYVGKIEQLLENISRGLAAVSPHVWLDIKRHAPRVYGNLEKIRGQIIPEMIGRLVQEGQEKGLIRPEIHPRLVGEVQLAAVRHLIQPEVFTALGLTPAQLPPQIFRLLFWGVLTAEGRREAA
jgi:AcrR family transcriptional regulator